MGAVLAVADVEALEVNGAQLVVHSADGAEMECVADLQGGAVSAWKCPACGGVVHLQQGVAPVFDA